MFALADIFNYFPHKFSGLGTGRFSLARVHACTFNGCFRWHKRPFVVIASRNDSGPVSLLIDIGAAQAQSPLQG